jgi:hypothetical protein
MSNVVGRFGKSTKSVQRDLSSVTEASDSMR